MIVNSIEELVGHTPTIKLSHLADPEGADVYVKLEYYNPAGSIKDRVAFSMISEAEKSQNLKPGMTIVEPTSGNTGIGLAMAGALKGYKVLICMPETMSIERRKLMEAYGAELVLTPGAEGMKGAIAKAEELAQDSNFFMPMQFENAANPLVHETQTSQEILSDFAEMGLPDVFVAGVGTGGTLSGIGRTLKKANPSVRIVALEPETSAVLLGNPAGKHRIQGIGAGFKPSILDDEVIDEVMLANDTEALELMSQIGAKEGFLPGISGCANILAALKIAKDMPKGTKVLTVAPDAIDKYLSV